MTRFLTEHFNTIVNTVMIGLVIFLIYMLATTDLHRAIIETKQFIAWWKEMLP